MITKVCDRESRLDLWFENHLVMNLAVKIYKERYDGHNKTYWAEDFFESVLLFILILHLAYPKIEFHILF